MIVRLTDAGMSGDSPPIGFMGGPDFPFLEGVQMVGEKFIPLAEMDGEELIEFDELCLTASCGSSPHRFKQTQ